VAAGSTVAPLDSAAVRRWTRRATAARASTTLGQRSSGAWGGVVAEGVGVAGSLPLLATLGTGGPTPLLVAVQAAWSLLLAVAMLVRLGRRRSPGS
jgi:amino acid transporter